MESGACAVGAGLLQPQTGRPVTKHRTAQGLTTTPAAGTDTRSTASVITATLPNTVSGNARTAPRPAAARASVRAWERVMLGFIPVQWGDFPCAASAEVSGEACRGGAARKAQPALRVLFEPGGAPQTSSSGSRYLNFSVSGSGFCCIAEAVSKARQIPGEGTDFPVVRLSRHNNPYLLEMTPAACLRLET